MTCQFHSLYYGDEGYVVCCKNCGQYQIAFLSVILSLSEKNFIVLCKQVETKCTEESLIFNKQSKSIIITTPAMDVSIVLTGAEAIHFNKILQEADNEMKAINLLSLFNQ